MKIRQITREAIPNRPRTMHYYVMRAKALRDIEATFHRAATIIKGLDFPPDLNYALSHAGIKLDRYDLESLGHQFESQYSGLSVDRLAGAIESFVQFGNNKGTDFFRFIPSALEDVTKTINERWREIFEQFPTHEQIENAITNKDYQLLDPQYYDAGDIAQTEKFLALIKLLSPAIKKFIPLLDDLNYKIKAQQDYTSMIWKSSWDSKQVRPEHQEAETLYHATAYANEIVQQGFAAEPPEGRRGVGNLGHQDEISFTHDLMIAQHIVRCLKELNMIANGQLKARTIADWVRRENIPNFPWQEFMHVYKGINQYYAPQYEDTTFDRFDIVQTAKLYEKYIWLSKIHPNPVFISIGELVKTLVGRSVNDIGVLACQVRLDLNQAGYHVGESEFRVKPDAIQSIKRVM